jgi:galactofuranosylgalactofuranosylrhamnosyl-N-acetylglucosaminyl-diphospho-decaprenol beta-1,5/1,6-galactofuranosyltransferase
MMHSLQPVILSDKTAILASELEGFMKEDIPGGHPSLVGWRDGHAEITGLFGEFFEGYWRHHTAIEDVWLCFHLAGQVRAIVKRRYSESGREDVVIDQEVAAMGQHIALKVCSQPGDDSHLNVSFIASSAHVELREIFWGSETAPLREVKVTAAICTFNREKELRATLQELLCADSGLFSVVVVNQGEAGLPERIRDLWLPDSLPANIVEQPNLGGAGGFTRGMIEAKMEADCTHVLLLDDDIDLDRHIIARMPIVLSYLREDHCIGGAMLDLEQREILFSVGDVVSPTGPGITNLVDHENDNMLSPVARDYVARQHDPDFNGWWCFAFPVKALDKAGYPLPMFIRGDDVEFGFRLKRAGFKTIPWPGIAVWHAPFYKKRSAWHYFYDKRNALFMNEMHDRFSKLRMAGHLSVGFLNHLLRYDYDRAWMSAQALSAFNSGPSCLTDWTAENHKNLTGRPVAEPRPLRSGETSGISPSRSSRLHKGPGMILRALWDLTVRRHHQEKPTPIMADDWRPTIKTRPADVEIAYPDEGVVRIYTHSRTTAGQCTKYMITALAHFLLRRTMQRSAVAVLCSEQQWRSYLHIQPELER